MDDARLLCVSPPATAAGVALFRHRAVPTLQSLLPIADRDRLPAVSSGILRLSPPRTPLWASRDAADISASFLVSDPVAFVDFTTSFDLDIPHPSVDGGASVSICAGQAVAVFPASGLQDGWCLTYTHRASSSFVTLDERGTRLAFASLTLTRDSWRRVEITLVNASLSLTDDGQALMRKIRLSEWQPTERFQIGFTARRATVVPESVEWLRSVRIVAGSLLVESPAIVEVSLNGLEYTNGGAVAFTYLSEPHLASIHPIGGPTGGATLIQLGVLAPSVLARAVDIRCRFATRDALGDNEAPPVLTSATWHPSDRLVRCHTPPSPTASGGRVATTLVISVDGHTLDDGDGVHFAYFPSPTLSQLWPSAGPIDGATDIVVHGGHSLGAGAGIAPYLCRFFGGTTEAIVLPATAELRSEVLRCRTPPSASPNTTLVELSLNGQQYHSQAAVSFSFYETPRLLSISPSSGTVLGQTATTIYGTGFTSLPPSTANPNLCRWGNLTTNITTVNATHITCPSPRAPVGRRAVEVTMNGQQYTSDGHSFAHYLAPHIHRLSVPGTEGELNSWLDPKVTLPQAGYILVRVWGSGFMGGTDYRCRLNNATDAIRPQAQEPGYVERERDFPSGKYAEPTGLQAIVATYDESLDCILCWSNQWLDGVNHVEVTLNGREYTTDGASILINQFW